MSESHSSNENNRAFPLWAKTLLIGLLIVVAVQSWLIHQVTSRQQVPEATSQAPAPAEAASPIASTAAVAPSPIQGLPEEDPWWAGDTYDPQTWDPFVEMQRMRERMDRIFGEAFGRFQQSDRFAGLINNPPPFTPQIDVRETDKHYKVTVNLPGMDEDSHIEVDVEGQRLRISGKTEEQRESQADDGIVLRRERRLGRFERIMMLPDPVDAEAVTSTFKNGVFHITIPKKSESNGS